MLKQINSYRKDTLVYEIDHAITNNDLLRIKNAIVNKEKKHKHVNLFIKINTSNPIINRYIQKFKIDLNELNILNKVVYLTNKPQRKASSIIDSFFTSFSEKHFDLQDANNAWKWVESDS
ncbi:SpoIIAA family protein [Aureivirga marina]|uniref:STAS/SEC14 domain-containing protein n=1 Tax=Aureivirga marina TaxID=1182451 RepID=UPI0018C99B19|nr:STAS/SEC14 domain-containing protein [Aureivirga marina]